MERGWIHGGKEFREKMRDHLKKDDPILYRSVYDGQQKRDLTEAAVTDEIQKACGRLKISGDTFPLLKKSHPSKLIIAVYNKANYAIGNRWISQAFQMGHPSVVGRYQSVISGNRQLSKEYKRFEKGMNNS